MKRKFKITLFLLTVLMLSISTNVQAGYQSIPNASNAKEEAYQWIYNVRQLEAPGNGMGLGEIMTNYNLVSDTSNNIDVHMIKNTEWGAMAILSASNYGKQGNRF